MQVTILSEKITRIRSEILVVGFFQDSRPLRGYAGEIDWFTNGSISSLIQQNKINGTFGEATLLATSKVAIPKILLIGLGQKGIYTYKILQQLSTHVREILSRLKVHEAIAELWGQEQCSLDLVRCLDIFLQGWMGNPSQTRQSGEPDLLTLLTHESKRIKELAHRILEYERTGILPSPSGDLPQGLGSLRVEAQP